MSVRQQRTPNKFIAKGFLSIHLTKLLFFEIINYPPLRKVASYLTHNFSPQDVSHYSNPAHYSDPIRNVLLTPSTHSDFFYLDAPLFSAFRRGVNSFNRWSAESDWPHMPITKGVFILDLRLAPQAFLFSIFPFGRRLTPP